MRDYDRRRTASGPYRSWTHGEVQDLPEMAGLENDKGKVFIRSSKAPRGFVSGGGPGYPRFGMWEPWD